MYKNIPNILVLNSQIFDLKTQLSTGQGISTAKTTQVTVGHHGIYYMYYTYTVCVCILIK